MYIYPLKQGSRFIRLRVFDLEFYKITGKRGKTQTRERGKEGRQVDSDNMFCPHFLDMELFYIAIFFSFSPHNMRPLTGLLHTPHRNAPSSVHQKTDDRPLLLVIDLCAVQCSPVRGTWSYQIAPKKWGLMKRRFLLLLNLVMHSMPNSAF